MDDKKSKKHVEVAVETITPPAVPKRPVADKITRVLRGARILSQDVFKLKVANRLFNLSWKAAQPKLIEQEHCHFFRSINDQGIPNEYSTAIGGHFHKVTLEWDEDGTLLSAKCGPPLHKTQVTMGASKRKVSRIVPVTFDNENLHTGILEHLPDSHTHEMDYLYTDEFTTQKREAMRAEEAAKVKALLGEQTLKNMTTPAVKPNPQAGNFSEA